MMTRLKGLLAAAAATAMVTATTAAAAPSTGVSVARAGTPARDANQLGADVPRGTLISIGILAILIVVVLVSVGGDGDSPSSP